MKLLCYRFGDVLKSYYYFQIKSLLKYFTQLRRINTQKKSFPGSENIDKTAWVTIRSLGPIQIWVKSYKPSTFTKKAQRITLLGFHCIYDPKFILILYLIFGLAGTVRLHVTLDDLKIHDSNPSDALGRESECNFTTRLLVTLRSN